MRNGFFIIGLLLIAGISCTAQEDKVAMATDGVTLASPEDAGSKMAASVKERHTIKSGGKTLKPATGPESRAIHSFTKAAYNTADKDEKKKKGFVPILTAPPVCVQTMFEKYSKQRMGTCVCGLTSKRMNQGSFSNIGGADRSGTMQQNAAAMFKDVAEGDGSFKFGLSERTTIKLDLGFLSGSKSRSTDMPETEDISTEEEANLSVGVMFGLW